MSSSLVRQLESTLGLTSAEATQLAALHSSEHPLSEEDFIEMVLLLREGESPASIAGYDGQSLTSIETMALGLYQARHYDEAARIYSWLCDMNPGAYSTAWRGLGACLQATGQPGYGLIAYMRALELDPTDVVSRSLAGECCLEVGEIALGKIFLKEAVEQGLKQPALKSYTARAKALLAASETKAPVASNPDAAWRQFSIFMPDGTIKDVGPATLLYTYAAGLDKAAGTAALEQTPADAEETVSEAVGDPEAVAELVAAYQEICSTPGGQAKLQEISDYVRAGDLSLRELGGFTKEQMDAGYAVACEHINAQELSEALQLISWMLNLDGRDARFYHLAGLCMHQMKLWPHAEVFYEVAFQLGNTIGATRIYQGEATLMQGEADRATEVLEEGQALAIDEGAASQNLVARAKLLLQTAKLMRDKPQQGIVP